MGSGERGGGEGRGRAQGILAAQEVSMYCYGEAKGSSTTTATRKVSTHTYRYT